MSDKTRKYIQYAVIMIVVLFILVLVGYNTPNDWTGFRETFTQTKPSIEHQPAKTLWDWLQLLIIPLVLSVLAIWFNTQQRKTEQEIAEKNKSLEQSLANDNRYEDLLRDYLQQFSKLLLENDLAQSIPGDPVRNVATAMTLTVLRRLDGDRRAVLLQHLVLLGLVQQIGPNKPIISLNGAELSDSTLNEAYLQGVDLSGARLDHAHLENAMLEKCQLIATSLKGAYLAQAKLTSAKLTSANLQDADLTSAYLEQCHLEAAHLEGAHLERAYLEGAHLERAYLDGAHLEGTVLDDVHLEGASITQQQLKAAKWTRPYHI